MLREPKTDRPLGVALAGSLYTVVAVARTGDTLAPAAYRYIRDLFGTEQHFLWAAAAVSALQLLALLTHGLARVLACTVVTFLALMFGVMIMRAAPNALLPGFSLVVGLCNGLALFDSLRLRFDK